jgi:hypothetical protein
VSLLSGLPLDPDGSLLPHDSGAAPGRTELAVRALGRRLRLDDEALHAALEQGRTQEFERTKLYRGVFALAERVQGRPAPRALVPQIELQGPKISRKLTTEWYAQRVDGRFKRCLAR